MMKTNSNTVTTRRGVRGGVGVWMVCALLGAPGLYLTIAGVYLIMLGGSPAFAIGGALAVVSATLILTGRSQGVLLYAVVVLLAMVWALWEVGLQFWPLMSRLYMPAVLLFLCLWIAPRLHWERDPFKLYAARRLWMGVLGTALSGALIAVFLPHGMQSTPRAEALNLAPEAMAEPKDWKGFGGTPAGLRFTAGDEITRENVSNLAEVWRYRTGDVGDVGDENQNTPMQIGDKVFVCTPKNQVHALDADTGELRWKFAPELQGPSGFRRCRTLAYAEVTAPVCARRIITTTNDGRLLTLDAETGGLCAGFGEGGQVDLRKGVGGRPEFYSPRSGPMVAGDVIIVGSAVADNQELPEPSGVIRAFDVIDGKLRWAWDLDRPDQTGIVEGETYSLSTPNLWGFATYDPELELVYLPLGNGIPDHWGAHRTEAADAYTDAIVALDVRTGRERWKFQTVHHDLWDYDLAAQPALHTMRGPDGQMRPVLIQSTKTGQLFVLDRRDGSPVTAVEERPVPQGGLPGDWTSPTQPFSTGMPSVGLEVLRESDMWGSTPLDQLACRISFRQKRYGGPYTPLSLQGTIVYPSTYGGMNWGGVSIDPNNDVLIANDIRIPMLMTSIRREDFVPQPASRLFEEDGYSVPMAGTPFGLHTERMKSPLGIPCKSPPWGTLTAIDLRTRRILWQRPVGTVKDTYLHGVRVSLPLPLGMPTMGGSLTTAGGLVFYSGTTDYYIRAFDLSSGDIVWKERLPVGSQSGPISYVSAKSGRQFVVVTAGGGRESPDRGDYVIAFALPAGQ